MRIFRSRKRSYIVKLRERAHFHDDLAARLEEEGDEYASDIAKLIAEVFRLVAHELSHL